MALRLRFGCCGGFSSSYLAPIPYILNCQSLWRGARARGAWGGQ